MLGMESYFCRTRVITECRYFVDSEHYTGMLGMNKVAATVIGREKEKDNREEDRKDVPIDGEGEKFYREN